MPAKKQQRDITPIPAVFHRADTPEDVSAKPWTFEQGHGETQLEQRTMAIPLDASKESAGIRAHEMLHAALSPYNAGEMDFATLAAEDGRVETLATAAGVKRPMPMTPKEIREKLDAADQTTLPLLAIASTGAPTESIVQSWLAEHGRDDIADLMHWARGKFLAGESAAPVANLLRGLTGVGRSLSGAPEPKPPDVTLMGHGAPRKPTGAPMPMPALGPGRGTLPGGKPDGPPPPKMLLPVKVDEYKQPGTDDHDVQWAPMAIDTPPLPVILSDVRGTKRTRSTDSGTVPRKLYRIPLDGKVFTARKHRRQGTVLIDASGSMSLDESDIEEFVRSVPAAVIAAYWGSYYKGTLRVYADNGRMASHDAFNREGVNNEIDGPALWWLSKQRGPRVWVSDGGITSAGDYSVSDAMQREVNNILNRSRIRQINPYHLDDWQKAVIKALH